MVIGIMSDTHDHLGRVEQAINEFRARGVSEIIHCGDYVAPFVVVKLRDAGFAKIHGVLGNNDGEVLFLSAMFKDAGTLQKPPAFITVGGLRFAVMHEPMPMDAMEALPVDVVCYGHTHDAEIRPGKPLIINPGECCGWLRGRATIAVLDTEAMKAELVALQ